jgi:dihydrodipicolinate synthase/N-acetylneuraminate lyase
VGVIKAYVEGDARRLGKLFGALLRLSGTFYGAGGIRATKRVLDALGLPGGFPRLPQLPVSEAIVPALLQAIEELDIATIEGWASPSPSPSPSRSP